jgi:hypothetical protein
MLKRLSHLFVTFAIAFMAVFSVSAVSDIQFFNDPVYAGVFDGKSVDDSDANNGEAGQVVNSIFKAANVFAGIVLAISIIMIIVGGLRYILSNGDTRAAEQGKMILIYSGIGIVIALSAFVIARLFSSFKFGG